MLVGLFPKGVQVIGVNEKWYVSIEEFVNSMPFTNYFSHQVMLTSQAYLHATEYCLSSC